MRSDVSRRRGRYREEPDAGDRFGMASESEARNVLDRPWRRTSGERLADLVPNVQGAYYVASGIWPWLHMSSFEAVTGHKTDKWLSRTVGVLTAALGAGLLAAGRRGYVSPDLRLTTQLAAAGFAAAEAPTALRGRISPIYLAEAVVELGFIAANAWASGRGTSQGDRLDILARREASRLLR